MLRRRTRTTCHVSTQIHANKKSTWRRRWKTSQSPLYSHLKSQHVVTCCERLHTSANIAQQETTLLGPTMLRVVASVCTGLNPAAISVYIKNHLTFNIQGNVPPLSVWQQETKGPTRLVTFIKCNSIYDL